MIQSLMLARKPQKSVAQRRFGFQVYSASGMELSDRIARDHQAKFERVCRSASPLERVFQRTAIHNAYYNHLAVHVGLWYRVALRLFQRIGKHHRSQLRAGARNEVPGSVDRRRQDRRAPSIITQIDYRFGRVDHIDHTREYVHKNVYERDAFIKRRRFQIQESPQKQVLEMILKRENIEARMINQNRASGDAGDKRGFAGINEKVATRGGHPTFPAELGLNDLKRITDHVVNSLDRRVIAMRERLGKV